MQVTVAEGQYNLTADLIRFIVPPSEDSLLVALPRTPHTASQSQQHPGGQPKPKVSTFEVSSDAI